MQPEQRKLVFTRGGGADARAAAAPDAPALYLKVLRPDARPRSPRCTSGCCRTSGAALRARRRQRDPPARAAARRVARHVPAPRPPAGAVAGRLFDLLDRLDDAELQGEPEAGSDARLRRHVRLLRAIVPEESARLERLREALSGAAPQPTVITHGDFHEGNILVGDPGISGLLDVDDAGPGERVDDLGVLIGRIWVLGHGRAGELALRYAADLLRRSEADVDPAELRRRVGVALVGRATGPFRNQLDGWREQTRARIALAERWAGGRRG